MQSIKERKTESNDIYLRRQFLPKYTLSRKVEDSTNKENQ